MHGINLLYFTFFDAYFFDSAISVFPEISHFNIFPWGTSNLVRAYQNSVHNVVISLTFNTSLLIQEVTELIL